MKLSLTSSVTLVATVFSTVWTVVHARAILGIDLGSLYMKVALVQSGSPLEIVVNMHSKRKTEQMILFERGQRFYGADANALLARKSKNTPTTMSIMLGRDDEHPAVKVLMDRHYPVLPAFNETRNGLSIKVDGSEYTPEELVSMVLQHASDISAAHAASQGSPMANPPKDVVITVPCFATQRERLALLDAALLADLNVLTLIDENTAAALQYSMDKTFADAEGKKSEDQLILFYNLGASSLQVSVVHFFSYEQPQKYGKSKRVPALSVLAKSWDETLGGLAFDALLVDFLADTFNAAWRDKMKDDSLDIRTKQRAMTKIRIQANKVKHVLSANNEIPVYMDSLQDDIPLKVHMTRQMLEEMAAPLLERASKPFQEALDRANKTIADLTAIELIGGGMRVPAVQSSLRQLNETMELGLHMNADESMALGASFAGANLSTAFRVRHIGMTDLCPFAYQVSLANKEETADEPWKKQTTVFKSFGKMGIKKTITFSHDQDVTCDLDYSADLEQDLLPPGSEHALLQYEISGIADFAKKMAEKELGTPKVSLQFELSQSGIASLIKAEASVEEKYMGQEEIEVEDEEAAAEEAAAAAAEEEEAAEAEKEEAAAEEEKEGEEKEAKSEKKEKKKKKDKPKKPKMKKVMVDKEMKRVHKETLTVAPAYKGKVQPHTPALLQASRAKLEEMDKKDKERIMLEESRNKVESYIYHIKNTLTDKEEEIKKVATEDQMQGCMDLALAAQEWMDDDGYDADFATMEEKYLSLSEPFEKIMLRMKESVERPKAVADLEKKLGEIEVLMEKWTTTKPQVTEDERSEVLEDVEIARKWLADKQAEQAAKLPHQEPAFLSTEVPKMLRNVEKKIMRLSKKPKPKPPKKEKKAENETKEESSTEEDAADDETKSEEEEKPAEDEEVKPAEEKTEAEEEKAEDDKASDEL